jgi:peptidoglycan hydrolase-like protein with peptidoglycan-binding domain
VAPPPAAPVATASGQQLPDEAAMTDPDRRLVQTALARLGYYGIKVDGVFGTETRAEIRRFQHEIGSETTGRITAEQATRLVNSR